MADSDRRTPGTISTAPGGGAGGPGGATGGGVNGLNGGSVMPRASIAATPKSLRRRNIRRSRRPREPVLPLPRPLERTGGEDRQQHQDHVRLHPPLVLPRRLDAAEQQDGDREHRQRQEQVQPPQRVQ